MHLHILGPSCKYVKRAIMISGSAFNYWTHYGKNNHLDLLRETFRDDLGNKTTDEDVFNFMLTADVDVIVKKTPVVNLPNGVIEFYWSAVIEGILCLVSFTQLIFVESEIRLKTIIAPFLLQINIKQSNHS